MQTTLYQRIGGQMAVNGAVEILYRRLLADDRLNSFFEGMDMETLMQKQKMFLTYAFGGMSRYPGKSKRAVHERLVRHGLSDLHFDAMLDHLDGTLDELGVAADLKREVLDTVEQSRNDVLGRAKDVPGPAESIHQRVQLQGASAMKRTAILLYGVISYALFFGVFCYAYGWLANILVPLSIDSAPAVPLGSALLVNVALLGIFAIQHSVMARPTFKKWWTTIVPEPAERSTYVLFSSVLMIAMFWLWQPMGGLVWNVENAIGQGVLYGAYTAGWLLILLASFSINHFDLFGLRQVWLQFRNRPYTKLKFGVPIFYKYVRHPLYVGWLLAFWCTPTMTMAHLVFAITTTAYILVAIQLEERNLVEDLPGYADYRRRVPALVPFTKSAPAEAKPQLQTETVEA